MKKVILSFVLILCILVGSVTIAFAENTVRQMGEPRLLNSIFSVYCPKENLNKSVRIQIVNALYFSSVVSGCIFLCEIRLAEFFTSW